MWWKDVITALGTVAVSLGGWEALKWILTRRSNTRKAEAEADKAGIEAGESAFTVLERTNTFLAQQLEQKEQRFAEQTERLRKKQDECDQLRKDYCELELKAFRFHCEVRGCADREPPNGY